VWQQEHCTFVAPRMYMSRVWQPPQTNWAISVPVTHECLWFSCLMIGLLKSQNFQITYNQGNYIKSNRLSEEKQQRTRRWHSCYCIANSTAHRGGSSWIHEKVSTPRTDKLTLCTWQSRKNFMYKILVTCKYKQIATAY